MANFTPCVNKQLIVLSITLIFQCEQRESSSLYLILDKHLMLVIHTLILLEVEHDFRVSLTLPACQWGTRHATGAT